MPELTQLAVTERGKTLDRFTVADVELALRTMILAGGDIGKTIGALAGEGIVLEHQQLRYWRDVAFAHRHLELRRELSADIGEDIAGRALERAKQIDEAEAAYVDAALERIEEVPAARLAAAARDLAKAKGENIEKSRLLRDQPTEVREVRNTAELLDVLARQGVLTRDPRADALEGHAEELD